MRAVKNNDNPINEAKIIDQIKVLGIDMINEAGSGHPGIVLGASPIIYTLYAHHLMIDPLNPNYFNRDRFVLSAGHGSSMLYSTLYLAGYDLSLDDLKSFRKLGSNTPGHPEYMKTPGVDVTTGPLGEGLAMAVGMAMGEKHQEALINQDINRVIDYKVYVLCSDGDLMEGVSYEAASLAGTLKLNNLIVLYDSNDISLDGSTSLSFKENVRERFEALGWNTFLVPNGNDIPMLNKAINDAKMSDRPTLIEIKTIIGEFSKNEGTNIVHGKILDADDITNIKNKLNMRDIPFMVSQSVMEDFQKLIFDRCENIVGEFEKKFDKLPDDKKELIKALMNKDKSISVNDLDFELPIEKEAIRVSSGKVINAYCKKNDILFGGSADLFGACKNYIDDGGDFSSINYAGKNIYFGVREHAMGSIMNGLALVGFRPYCSTFLSFSDYLKPAIRMSAMMDLPVIYLFTHDSISVGEDGATHQPVEQLLSLRTIPNIDLFRPADANEVLGSYKAILEKKTGPSIVCLSRNEVSILADASIKGVANGGYIVKKEQRRLDGIIISTGENVHAAIEVSNNLFTKGFDIRVVSMPSIKRFLAMDNEYKDEILPVEIRKVVVEPSSNYNWNKIVFNDKYIISLDEFGDSGSCSEIYKKYGFDVESLEEKIENLFS